jgi:hypothetical protein
LTTAKVKALKVPGDYLDGRGLYLQVRNETSKSWLLKFSMQKRAREMGLGSAFDITLAKARDLRDGYRSLLAQGIGPIDTKKRKVQPEPSSARRRSPSKPQLSDTSRRISQVEKNKTRGPISDDVARRRSEGLAREKRLP